MKRRNALILFSEVVIGLVALDRFTKIIAVDALTSSPPVAFIPGVLDFVLVYNPGGAFGLFEGAGILFVGIAVGAIAAMVAYLTCAETRSLPVVCALSLMAGGALGNAWDRLATGLVPDFLHTLFIEFPVFNVADCCLTLGEIVLVVTLLLSWLRQGGRDGRQTGDGVVAETGGDVAAVADDGSAVGVDEAADAGDAMASDLLNEAAKNTGGQEH